MENFRLKVFRAVAKHLNFRRAAEELCLTQPAITLQIKALEQHLGVQLFDRSGVRIALTPAGTMLLKYAGKNRQVGNSGDDSVVTVCRRATGRVADRCIVDDCAVHLASPLRNVSSSSTLKSGLTSPHAIQSKCWKRWWRTKCPLDSLKVRPWRRDVRTEVFLEDEIVLMVPPAHEWSERGFVEPEELKQERLLMRERGSGTRRVVEMALQKRGVKPKHLNLAMEFDSTEGIITAVEAGLGIGFASLWSISKELQLGSLRVVPIRGVRIMRPLSVAYPPGQEPQGTTLAFLHFLRSRHDGDEPNAVRRAAPHRSSDV